MLVWHLNKCLIGAYWIIFSSPDLDCPRAHKSIIGLCKILRKVEESNLRLAQILTINPRYSELLGYSLRPDCNLMDSFQWLVVYQPNTPNLWVCKLAPVRRPIRSQQLATATIRHAVYVCMWSAFTSYLIGAQQTLATPMAESHVEAAQTVIRETPVAAPDMVDQSIVSRVIYQNFLQLNMDVFLI